MIYQYHDRNGTVMGWNKHSVYLILTSNAYLGEELHFWMCDTGCTILAGEYMQLKDGNLFIPLSLFKQEESYKKDNSTL